MKKDVSLKCNSCEAWFCFKCLLLLVADKVFKAISTSEAETDMIFVICKECGKLPVSTFHKKSLFCVVKIDALAEKFEKLSNIDKKVDESLNIMKKQLEVTKLNYADMVKKSLESKDEIIK